MIGRTRLGATVLALALVTGAWADAPPPKPLVSGKPVKITAGEAAGSIFRSKFAVKSETGPDGPATDVVLLRSKDQKVEMGMYEAGPSEQDIASYDDDEFMFFLAGSVTLTSADGTVVPCGITLRTSSLGCSQICCFHRQHPWVLLM